MKKILFSVSVSVLVVAPLMFTGVSGAGAAGKTPDYDYQLIYQSSPSLTMAPGEVKDIWIEVKNTGTKTWSPEFEPTLEHATFLGTGSVYDTVSRGYDYDSQFYYIGDPHDDLCSEVNACFSGGWYGRNRPAQVAPINIKPGYHTRFQFKLKAPDYPGIYKEYFTPVVEGITWMKDIGIYWEINVTRAQPYSFDYENLDNPINQEVNNNTMKVLNADEQLLSDSLKNQMTFGSIDGEMGLNVSFKLDQRYLDQNSAMIEDARSNLTSYGIPLDIVEQSNNTWSLENKLGYMINDFVNPSNAKSSFKDTISIKTTNESGAVTPILNGETEAVVDGSSGFYLKINNANLLNGFFSYAKPGNWYGEVATPCLDGGYCASNELLNGSVNNELHNLDTSTDDFESTLDFERAAFRDLSRAGITVENLGKESIYGEDCNKLEIKLDKSNVQKYIDIFNERSRTSQESINEQKAMIDQYLGQSFIDVWVNPTTKVIKKFSIEINISDNDVFDSFSFEINNVLKRYNDPAIVINTPTSYESMDKIDIEQKFMEKISTKATGLSGLKVRIAVVGNDLGDKYNEWKNKIKEYIKNNS